MKDSGDRTSGAHSDVLAELEAALSEQIACAESEEFDSIDELQHALAVLLERANAIPGPLSVQSQQRLERIRQLYRRLLLTLSDSRRDTAEKLQHMRRGQKTLRAYQDGGR